MKKWYEDGNEPWTKNNKHTPETIENIIKNSKKGMNKLEQEVSNFLTNNNIEHSFNFFINNGDVCKQYDFKIGNILLEIDGDYWHGGPGVKKHHFSSKKTKENDLLKDNIPQERGYKVIRIWQSEIKSNPNIILEKIQI
jgi:very-short-patch-repair endonuclease